MWSRATSDLRALKFCACLILAHSIGVVITTARVTSIHINAHFLKLDLYLRIGQ